ncbi:metallophosphoesterase family protein [Arenibaculum pallidiluteum]|uniref:metallophosphoesterase family protein n=1 Tax=Arenibaculum pallidiluteum TaxID=2812559 RepID=UPI001A970BE9|nr:metallophosphoesterase family protein [Arenibaculum pallidiluteum]
MNLLHRQKPHEEARAASVPRGVRVYAVGDIHGRLDLLTTLLHQIETDAAERPGPANYLVYLGDYVDRGHWSRQVIELLLRPPLPGFGAVFLRGNHEQAMLDFLENPASGQHWLRFGGRETLASYGIRIPPTERPDPALLEATSRALASALPPAHAAFLRHTRMSLTIGDYFFAHAGVRPSVPLSRQSPDDLLWIRDEFLKCDDDFGKIVVHGHTIAELPVIRANRIGIDTGAYATGHLTCLALEGEERRFIGT